MSSATIQPVRTSEPSDPIDPIVSPEPQISRGTVVTVARRRPKNAGFSLLQGLGVVVDHWRKSFRKLDDMTQTAGTFTTEYPEERLPLPEAYRNMPILLFDDETGHELCTSCFQCQRICPPQVIHMTQAKDPETGKPVPAVSEFIIEYDACMSCGFCAEVCPFDAIKMDHDFELSTADHPSLTVHKTDLLRPVSYYESIAPTFWQEARDNAYKKLANNQKRRPGTIGIAPQLVEQIKAAQLAAAPAPPPPPAPATDAPAAEPPADDLPTDKAARLAAIRARNQAKATAPEPSADVPAAEPPADELPTDKAARLAAIRARNQAKATAPEPSADVPAAEPPADDLPTDKAARLAAIRARNRAKQAQQAEPAPQAPEPPAAEPASPADDKAARLAAIRERNRAKQAQQAEPAPQDSSDSPPASEE